MRIPKFVPIGVLIAILTIASSFQAKQKSLFTRTVLEKDKDEVTFGRRINLIKLVSNGMFRDGVYTDARYGKIAYRLLQTGTGREKLPLVVLFHGSGAVGEDNAKQMNGLVKMWALPETQEKYKAVILAPQFPSRSSNYVIDPVRKVLTSVPQPCVYAVLSLIDSIRRVCNIDDTRIYAVGYSMGGSTVTNVLSLRPALFAAGVSISGIPQFDSVARLKHIPIWLIHGDADTDNPIASDERLYKELAPGGKARFWVFRNTGHEDIFTNVIMQQQIPEWLWAMRK